MTAQEPTTAQSPSKLVDEYVAVGKNLLALLRDGALVVVFLLLLIVPKFVGDRLARAGFEEGDLMGFKWKNTATEIGAKATKLDQQLKDANLVIASQSRQLAENQDKLARLANGGVLAAGDIKALSDGNRSILETATKAKTAISNTIDNAAPVVAQAEKIIDSDIQWAVVFSGNANLDGGKYERDVRAPKFGVKTSNVYYRQRSYRVATLIDRQADAPGLLDTLRPRYPDAYVVNFKTWCPNPDLVQAGGYYTC
ncbi:MAG TPA: hypothetical protein VN158_12405 [Caulobacter sp.]|nr:hypothetical protein [Caulobacter sp.]